jgi:hypothetical protein
MQLLQCFDSNSYIVLFFYDDIFINMDNAHLNHTIPYRSVPQIPYCTVPCGIEQYMYLKYYIVQTTVKQAAVQIYSGGRYLFAQYIYYGKHN